MAQAIPFNQRELRNALGSFGTGVTVITTVAADGSPVGLTASSFNSLSLDPPLVLWSLSLNSPSLDAFLNATHFAVNVLSLEQVDLSKRFGTRRPDKFAGVRWAPGVGDVPVLDECSAYFECRNACHYAGGDHLIFVGQVERFSYRSKRPLLFCDGMYFTGYPIQVLSSLASNDFAESSGWSGIG